jgi:hypothetical protein
MEHKIINTGDYLLIVDESEIKEGDCYLSPSGIWFYNHLNPNHNKNCKKVLAHLPLNNSPILEGVDLLPPLEDEVEKLLNDEINYWYRETGSLTSEKIVRRAFSIGLKAKEKYKYTEEDMIEAMLQISEYYANNINKDVDGHKKSLDIIQSLQQPKMPVGFKCEIKQKSVNGSIPVNQEWEYEPKTTTNPQGLTQWVGEYIY